MIASLPMYDMPETADANDRLWQAIRNRYGAGAVALDRTRDPHEVWDSPDLLLSQTCGLPYRSTLHRNVGLIGTPDYAVDGCPPGYYRSCIVARRDDPRRDLAAFNGARVARNDVRSQSGWAALLAHLPASGLSFREPERIIDTGSHAEAARAVAQDEADIAAIDAVTWRLLSREATRTKGLRVLCQTEPTPGLPLITGPAADPGRLFVAVSAAIGDLTQADRDCLCLNGLVRIPARDYLAVPMP